eukprot:m.64574 g.64574  ORF g.64574 m.64574 type:complete len:744 (+) comp35267_c0_seq1:2002-4233(+)
MPYFAMISANPSHCPNGAIELMARSAFYWNLLTVNVFPEMHQFYEEFRSYFSVAPSTKLLHRAVLALMKKFNITSANVIASRYRNERLKVEVASVFNQTEMDIRMFDQSLDQKVRNRTLEKIKNRGDFYIIALLDVEVLSDYLCEAVLFGLVSPEYVWIVPGSFYDFLRHNETLLECSTLDIANVLNGSFSFSTHHFPDRVSPSPHLPTNKTREEVVSEVRSEDGLGGYSYDGVTAIALMLNVSNGTLLFAGDKSCEASLVDCLKDISFTGVMGDIFLNDSSSGRVDILYHRFIDDINESFPVGINESVGIYEDSSGNVTRFNTPLWINGRMPPARAEIQHLLIDVFIGCTILLSCAILISILFLLFNLKFYNARVIQLSGPSLNVLIAIGSILIYIAWILDGFDGKFFYVEDAAALATCYVKTTLSVIGFFMYLSSLVMKTWRIRLIATRKQAKDSKGRRRSSFLTKLEKERGGVILVLLLTLVTLIIFGTWILIDRYEIGDHTVNSRTGAYIHSCYINSQKAFLGVFGSFQGIIVLYGLYLGWETRNVKIPYVNNSWYTMGSMGTAVFFIPFYFIVLAVFTEPGFQYIMVTISVVLMISTMLFLEAIPKVYAMLFRGEKVMKGFGGRIKSVRRVSMSQFMITKAGEINVLKRQNEYMKDVIDMLIEERNLSDATVRRMREQFLDTPALPEILVEDDKSVDNNGVTNVSSHEKRLKSVTFCELDPASAQPKSRGRQYKETSL